MNTLQNVHKYIDIQYVIIKGINNAYQYWHLISINGKVPSRA